MDHEGLQIPWNVKTGHQRIVVISRPLGQLLNAEARKAPRRLQSRSQTRARTIEEHLTDLGLSLYTFEAR